MTFPKPQFKAAVRWLCVFLCGLTLSACTQTVAENPGPDLQVPQRPLVAWLDSQPDDQYAETILDDPEFGANVTVQAYRAYYSAAGRYCRQVRVKVVVNAPPTETAVICRDDNNQWYVTPRISNGRHMRQ
jgi:hypothetical protein